MKKTLVIGYGNTLRSDDGVGVWIAGQLAVLHLPNVDVRTCHQLFPELSSDFVSYGRSDHDRRIRRWRGVDHAQEHSAFRAFAIVYP